MAKKASKPTKAPTAKTRSVPADQLEIKSVTTHYVGSREFTSREEAEAHLQSLRDLNRVAAPVAAIMNRTAARKRAAVKEGVKHAIELLVKYPELLAMLAGSPAPSKAAEPTPQETNTPPVVAKPAPAKKAAAKKAAPAPNAAPAKKVATKKATTKESKEAKAPAQDPADKPLDLSTLPPPGAGGPPPLPPGGLPGVTA